MKLKAYFIAPTMQQAAYWMEQWGFTRAEIRFLDSNRPNTLLGLSFDMPVFFCGNRDAMDARYDDVFQRLELDSAEVIYAEDLE